VLDEVQTLLQHRLRASRCTIEVDAEPRDASVVGDPSRLGQVLVNLVVNAIDAYEEREAADGRIVVRVRPGPGDTVVVEVEDHAGGIAADCLPRIFDELFTTKEPGRGTGLGLCIARNLVERSFGGALTVASTPGVGSRFTATLASAGVADQPAADPDPRRRAVG
jgi:C4-dicarboxylate-specific signal transduction histidine kinase